MRWCVCLLFVAVLLTSSSAGNSKKSSRQDIEDKQKQFISKFEDSKIFAVEDYAELKVYFKTAEGKELLESLIDATVPVFGRKDQRPLIENFWKQIKPRIPPGVATYVNEVEEIYNNINSPQELAKIIDTKGDDLVLFKLAQKTWPGVNVGQIMKFLVTASKGEGGLDLWKQVKKMTTPGINDWLKQNDYNLEAEGVFTLGETVFQMMKNKNEDDPTKNLLNLALPLLGTLNSKNGNGGDMIAKFLQNKESANMIQMAMNMFNPDGKTGNGGPNVLQAVGDIMKAVGKNSKSADKTPGDLSALSGMAQLASNLLSGFNSQKSTKMNVKKSSMVAAWEPTFRKILKDKSALAKVERTWKTINTMILQKLPPGISLEVLLTEVLGAVPGAQEHEATIRAAVKGLTASGVKGLFDKIGQTGKNQEIARMAAPKIVELLKMVTPKEVRNEYFDLVSSKLKTSLEDSGFKGWTLENWKEKAGPLIGIFTQGLPIKPIPLLEATQGYITQWMTLVDKMFDEFDKLSTEEMKKITEEEIADLLATIAKTDGDLNQLKTKPAECRAQVVCQVVSDEGPIRTPLMAAISFGRAISLRSENMRNQVLLLSALAPPRPCKEVFPCQAHQEL